MTPNQITVARVLAAFAAVALFTLGGHARAVDALAVLLTVAAIAKRFGRVKFRACT